MTPITAFLDGRLRLHQPEQGYRFSLDAPILADFIRCRPTDVLLEAGTGVGVIPLILSLHKPFHAIYAVEIQDNLAALAELNVRCNGAQGKVIVIPGDVRDTALPGLPERVDVVFANPPYRRKGSGRVNPVFEKAAARHELLLDLPALFRAAQARLYEDGHFFLSHLPAREPDLHREAARYGWHLRRRRLVYSFTEDPRPFLALFQWSPRPGPLQEETPLVVYSAPRVHSPEFRRIISASG